jgi:DNA-directed RNA polymerase subunit F
MTPTKSDVVRTIALYGHAAIDGDMSAQAAHLDVIITYLNEKEADLASETSWARDYCDQVQRLEAKCKAMEAVVNLMREFAPGSPRARKLLAVLDKEDEDSGK